MSKKKTARKRATRAKKKARARRVPKPLRIVDVRGAPERDGPGRPSPYVPEYAHIGQIMCEGGATDVELARAFSVDVATLYRWKARHPEFREALKDGKDALDDRVERSLYHRAVGYSHDAVKILQNGAEVVAVNYTEHYPPDTAAAFIWLKNRRGQFWRDRQEIAHETIERHEQELADDEIMVRLAELRDLRKRILEGELVLPALAPPAKA